MAFDLNAWIVNSDKKIYSKIKSEWERGDDNNEATYTLPQKIAVYSNINLILGRKSERKRNKTTLTGASRKSSLKYRNSLNAYATIYMRKNIQQLKKIWIFTRLFHVQNVYLFLTTSYCRLFIGNFVHFKIDW